ncbi:hypothetical protein M514_09376 [Trichuris suis]|uniref:Uncharacterized protein n=1 Tax=Trichuris suis TaxID=68888 RepID=A0A085N0A6_9BILA|nr:hypothetical protein M513_09376 [Trichuris suis]KFD62902.1 hypothetical protein M514_24942 [Trichuris suis]KFD68532.1 hypothetical protein M514_09376 [Trichuris suis]
MLPTDIPTSYGPIKLPLRDIMDNRRRGAQIRGKNRLSADSICREALQCNYLFSWRVFMVQTPRWHNDSDWKLAMKNYLVDSGLWQCTMSLEVNEEVDQRALAKINLSVSPCDWAAVRKARTAKKLWESFRWKHLCTHPRLYIDSLAAFIGSTM